MGVGVAVAGVFIRTIIYLAVVLVASVITLCKSA